MGFFGNMAVFSVSGGPIPTPPVTGSRQYEIAERVGPSYLGTIGTFDVSETGTLVRAQAFADWVASGTNVTIEIRKQSPNDGSNILLSTLQITAASSPVNGRQASNPVTSFSAPTLSEGDVLYAVATSNWGF